jgi:hypothetical protein
MNFLGNEVTIAPTFRPLLATREQIRIEAYFVAHARIAAHLFTPFVDDEPYRESVRRDLSVIAEATASQWALTLSSAEHALSKESYASLEREFLRIRSRDFTLRQATVKSIVPLTDPVPNKPELPPEETRLLRTVRELTADVTDFDEIRKLLRLAEAERPDLFTDSKFGERIKAKFEAKAFEILLNRRSR